MSHPTHQTKDGKAGRAQQHGESKGAQCLREGQTRHEAFETSTVYCCCWLGCFVFLCFVEVQDNKTCLIILLQSKVGLVDPRERATIPGGTHQEAFL